MSFKTQKNELHILFFSKIELTGPTKFTFQGRYSLKQQIIILQSTSL